MGGSVHLGIGHYGIGSKDGVNTVISRNVRALAKIDPAMKITLFGKLSFDYKDFIKPVPKNVSYRNIDEFEADTAARRLSGKSAADQQVHDYVWLGTNLAEVLVDRLEDMNVIMIENLGIGIQPYVTYAFFLYTEYIYTKGINKKFIYRCHDFVQQRPSNFKNIKKFYHPRFGVVPHWHSILYPSYPNIKYIAINRYDRWRLLEHGIEEDSIYYIPNSIDPSIVPPDDRSKDLRSIIIRREKLDPAVRFILYPVRCVRRKNVEEAIFLTKFFNCLSEVKLERNDCKLRQKYHLLVSLKPSSGEDVAYAEKLAVFVEENKLPVTIGLNDLISLDRETDPKDPSKLVRYGIGDLYSISKLVITTSVLEGFGFSYIEPWLVDRAVIGRGIPFLTPDFQSAGMKLGHLYSALIVDGKDFKDIGSDRSDPDRALEERLEKIMKLDDAEYLNRFIDRNETAVLATCRLFDEERRAAIIKVNRQVVEQSYSQEKIGKQLYEVIMSK
jgi:glycosyltransferase involved in cell wall biosynthesis